MPSPGHLSPLLADFLADAASLGRVRAVLRNCSGMAEVFCSCESFVVTPQWLTVRTPTSHLHVQMASLRIAELKDGRASADLEHPSIWFHARCAAPSLLLILDQTEGEERRRQEIAFARLCRRYGERVTFGAAQERRETVH